MAFTGSVRPSRIHAQSRYRDIALAGEPFDGTHSDDLAAAGRPIRLRDDQDDVLAALHQGVKRRQAEGP